jgi:hypothetical protein
MDKILPWASQCQISVTLVQVYVNNLKDKL